MKILYIIQCTNLGGMEQTSAEQARLMKERYGVEYRAISPRAAGKGAHLFAPVDHEMIFCDYRGKFNHRGHAAFAAQVAELARDADVIYVAGTCASSLRAANATGKPVILGHHYHHGTGMKNRLKWWLFYRLLARKLRGIIYISPFTRDEALGIAPWLEGRTSVARQAIPTFPRSIEDRQEERRAARERLHLPADAWIVGNAGWLIDRKRFDVFLEVAARLKQAVPEAHFVICGDGDAADSLKQQARRLGIEDCVEFRGWVSNLEDQYAAWDALLFNSDHDAVGRTVLEAIARQLNVVASVKHGGLSEFFAEGNRGFFFPDHDVEAMAQALRQLHDDPALASLQTSEALAHLEAVYTQEAAITPIHDLVFGKG